ncbi:Gfo/Idh/MocA family protein [Cerasicoccus fimbriatus]|uniref:Gfo/Idh/MocA family protein n=1 Tax=Cerasicoccus fimbriatus TaxID=3014554 RepID=UPI0022B5C677|nr:Gfo/Idh/MocA family oxidoreductase [Cerasicoccus sp. TK19100]
MSLPNIAVIGCGYWGKNHVRNFEALGALKLVCDASETGRLKAKELAPNVEVSDDPLSAFKRADIDGVVLATPAETHCSLTLLALEHGKHVLVEKPMALTYSEALKMADAADQHERVLMVGHLLEYHAAFLEIKRLIAEGALGKLQYIYSHRLNFGKIRVEENALWSFAPHDIALILRLTGQPPLEATCVGGNYITPNLADVTTSTMLFSGGVRAHIFVNWLNPFKEQKLVIIGDKKMAVFNDTEPVEKLVIYDQHVEFDGRLPVLAKAEREVIQLPESEPLRAECSEFLDCIATGRKPLTDARSGVDVLRVLQACQVSLQLNGRPTALSDIH